MEKKKSFLEGNWTWLVTTLVMIGVFVGGIKAQQKMVDVLQADCSSHHDKIAAIEISMVSLKNIEKDVDEIKSDIKEIKQIIYKPVVLNETDTNKVTKWAFLADPDKRDSVRNSSN